MHAENASRLGMPSDAGDVFSRLGLDPYGTDVTPDQEAALREDFEQSLRIAESRPIWELSLLEGDDPERDGRDEAWYQRDGSFVLRFGSCWMATEINGVDVEGACWELLEE